MKEITVVVERTSTDSYTGSVKEFPDIIVTGETYEETKINLFTALNVFFDSIGENKPSQIHIQIKLHLPLK